MTPWVLDANEMDAEDIVRFEHNLLHPNQEIEDFLDKDNRSKTIVIAPKGYGKTLLLKAKCKSMHDQIRHIIPSNGNLVDKPSGSPYVMNAKEYDSLRNSSDYWHNLWVSTFALAIIKEVGDAYPTLSDVAQEILRHEDLKSPCDIFAQLTTLKLGDYFKVREDYLRHLLPRLRQLKVSVAVFVDNIDEYYEGTLRELSEKKHAMIGGRQLKSYWYLSQLGLASASRELNHINNHLKIYVSIRREILQKAITSSYFGTQLRGKSLIIEYTASDLEAIIKKNITAEKKTSLQDPRYLPADPLKAFFGEVAYVTHPATGDQEKVVDFWLRHTLGRPREVVAIGERLSAVRPAERTASRIRSEVRKQARSLVRAYITEMQPHLEGFNPVLLYRHLNSNALSYDDLVRIAGIYDEAYARRQGTDENTYENHVFCSLYKIGLLGYVTFDVEARQWVQKFRPPGEDMLDGEDVLPQAEIYLIHPTLDEEIFEVNPQYYQGFDKDNIVGAGRPWQTERSISYILKGDIAGSAAFMKGHDVQKRFEACFEKAVHDHANYLDYAQRSGGDSIKLVNKNPIKLIEAARMLNQVMKESDFAVDIRFAGDAGFITSNINTSGGDQDGVYGEAVLRTARLEPHVQAGEIFVTRRFVDEFNRQYPNNRILTFSPCSIKDLRNTHPAPLDCIDGRFNLAKPGEHDTQDYTEIFWLKMQAADHV